MDCGSGPRIIKTEAVITSFCITNIVMLALIKSMHTSLKKKSERKNIEPGFTFQGDSVRRK